MAFCIVVGVSDGSRQVKRNETGEPWVLWGSWEQMGYLGREDLEDE